MTEQNNAQVIIIGGGPAGVSAALYLARAGVRTTIIENGPGALARAHKIDNYYGIAASGARLYAAGLEQAEALGVSIRQDEVLSVEYTDSFTLSLKATAEQLSAPALILATGTKNISLNLPDSCSSRARASATALSATASSSAKSRLPSSAAVPTPCMRQIICDIWRRA